MTAFPLAIFFGLLIGGGVAVGALWRERSRAATAASGAGLLFLLLAAQWSPAFDSYDADIWTYALMVERIADGQDMLRLEPFRLESPPTPHLSLVWLGLGILHRALPLPLGSLLRAAAVLSLALLSFTVWRLAGRLFGRSPASWTGVVLFWLSLPESWSGVVLGRFLALAFLFLATEAAFDLHRGRRFALKVALFVALTFYAHLFTGILAMVAVTMAVTAGGERPWPWRALVWALGSGAALAAPCLAYGLATAGLDRNAAHEWRPEQITILGLRWMSPSHLLELIPSAILLLAAIGLSIRPPPERQIAARTVTMGTLLTLVVLVTPLYHLTSGFFGGWMAGRVAALAFPWLAASLALERLLTGTGGGRLGRALGVALSVAAATQGASRCLNEWAERRYDFTPRAQADALALRDTLRGQSYLGPDLLVYGTAALTLGRPLGVPPGHASPFGDFRRQQRRVERALATNTPGCWAALFGLYPDTHYLITPGPHASAERALWEDRFPGVSPEEVRQLLLGLGALRPVRKGAVFQLDEVGSAALTKAGRGTSGMGRGSQCRTDQ